MKITVLGCGALGQLWLAALHARGHQVQGWLRVPQPACSLHLINLTGETVHITLPANDKTWLADSDLLLVTLKAWQIANAVRQLTTHLAATCPIILLHNGISLKEELAELKQPLLRAVTTQAACREGQKIIHTAGGITYIGPLTPFAHDYSDLATLLHQCLPAVSWHDDMRSAIWTKLAINCVINPLTVLHNCPNGELNYYRDEVIEVCKEVAAVMTREQVHTTSENLISDIFKVINATAGNISSMLQDIRARRHTEIDYITGYLIHQAHAHGLATPANDRLYQTIKTRENAYAHFSASVPDTWQ